MKLEIKSVKETVLYAGEAGSTSELLQDAVRFGTNLSGANLFGANLAGTNLSGANLFGANLAGTNLSGANLFGANLAGTNLSGANLFGAFLDGAYLDGANPSGANLICAKWGQGCKIGEQLVNWVDALVVCDGYCKSLCAVGGVAWIMSGCRWFALADARKHWAARDDRATTRAMLEGIAAVAKFRGLREG